MMTADAVSELRVIHRVFADAAGESHWGTLEVALDRPGPAGLTSALIAGSGVVFRRTKGDYDYDFHAAPARQFVACLDAGVDVTTSDGVTRRIAAGEVFFVEDTFGKGHKSAAVDGAARTSLFLPVSDSSCLSSPTGAAGAVTMTPTTTTTTAAHGTGAHGGMTRGGVKPRPTEADAVVALATALHDVTAERDKLAKELAALKAAPPRSSGFAPLLGPLRDVLGITGGGVGVEPTASTAGAVGGAAAFLRDVKDTFGLGPSSPSSGHGPRPASGGGSGGNLGGGAMPHAAPPAHPHVIPGDKEKEKEKEKEDGLGLKSAFRDVLGLKGTGHAPAAEPAVPEPDLGGNILSDLKDAFSWGGARAKPAAAAGGPALTRAVSMPSPSGSFKGGAAAVAVAAVAAAAEAGAGVPASPPK